MPPQVEQQVPGQRRWVYIIPLALFAGLMLVFFIGLGLNPSLLPSPLIGKPAPRFSLPRLDALDRTISEVDLQGEPSLLNIWATWCVSCRYEHPVLMKIADSGEVPVYGLLYKDEPIKALAWLQEFGNPYRANAVDLDGRTGIEWGVYGAPETFLIDREGIVRYKHVGPISWDDWQNTLLPKLRSLRDRRGV